jgi:hypothetical protein
MGRLRREILPFPREDGGLDLVDLLFDRLVRLDAAEAAQLESGALDGKLEALMLVDSEAIDDMRRSAWASRALNTPSPSDAVPVAANDWSEANLLPPLVAPAWRDPERLRRLAEERASGRRYLMLRGFVSPEAAFQLRAEASALAFSRMDNQWLRADRFVLDDSVLPAWRAFVASPVVRRLLGGVLGVELPATTVGNVWRLGRDDHFGVHPDGRLYRGTISLGLCEDWTAADGGAIAFGDPTERGFQVRERWLPHAGDVCLFAPDRTTFHAVEPVRGSKLRLSVTSWWMAS